MRRLFLGCTLLALGLAARPAAADSSAFSLKLEPGVAVPTASPQTDHLSVGGGAFGRVAYGVTPYLDLQLAGGFFGFGGKGNDPNASMLALGGGPRLQLPHEGNGLSPWIDADLLYVHTGSVNPFGFDVGGGVGIPATADRSLWVGLFGRYVFVNSQAGTGDAGIVVPGLYAEWHPLSSAKSAPPADSDSDGTTDDKDRCPQQAGPHENQGCPWPDTDGDGTTDDKDRCPQQAGPRENQGCPWPDTDGDGTTDDKDRCPKEPGPASNGGCPQAPPPPPKAEVKEERIEINQKIAFAFDSAEILAESWPILDAVVAAMKSHAELQIRVEGHTDTTGALDYNVKLSGARAESVMKYLVAHGIEAKRLKSEGFGPQRPLAPNDTEANRAINRRVEFVITR